MLVLLEFCTGSRIIKPGGSNLMGSWCGDFSNVIHFESLALITASLVSLFSY